MDNFISSYSSHRSDTMKNKLFKGFAVYLTISFLLTLFCPIAYGKPLRVNAVSAIAIDGNTGIVLFEQNGHKVIPMASTTKIITCLVALKYGDLDKEMEISKNAASIRGSKVGYKAGEKITLKELLYGLMLKSGNDCAIAIAEGLCGSIEEFCKRMNEYALEIGLVDSHFESPHGLDSMYHYSSAYDLATVTKKAKEIKEFSDIVSSTLVDNAKTGFTKSFMNINKILYQIPEANGVKTGYTGKAGKCLVSSIKYEDSDIIIVTLNCSNRWEETKRIYEYVKENYSYKKIAAKEDILGEVAVKNSKNKIQLVADKDIVIPIRAEDNISKEVVLLCNEVNSTVKPGQNLGMLIIKNNEEILIKEKLYAKNGVNNKRLSDYFKGFIK
jgi:D-alanyl-D-alanine carboxypeptidase (penicillin-binding protein 5/6)